MIKCPPCWKGKIDDRIFRFLFSILESSIGFHFSVCAKPFRSHPLLGLRVRLQHLSKRIMMRASLMTRRRFQYILHVVKNVSAARHCYAGIQLSLNWRHSVVVKRAFRDAMPNLRLCAVSSTVQRSRRARWR